ncbi:hypothetical protein MAR_009559, partial [Mya arenaria]
ILIKRILCTVQFDDTDSDTDNGSDEVPDISSVKSKWQTQTTVHQQEVRMWRTIFIYNKNPVSAKSKACHRQLKKARKFAKEGYVYDMDYNGLDNSNYCFTIAWCKPSMKELVTVTGRIEGGKCNCKTGLTVNEKALTKPHPEVYQAGPCQDPEKFLEDAGLGKVYPQSVLYQTLNPEITVV